MRNVTLVSVLLSLLTIVSFSSCTPSQEYEKTTKEIISQGQWTVDYYYTGQDKTAQFSNYEFTFGGNGTVTCEQGGAKVSGNWALAHDAARNEVLLIDIQSVEPSLSELNEHWSVNNCDGSTIIMSDGNSSTLRLRKR